MQDRWDSGQMGCRTRGIQDRSDHRKGEMQESSDAGKEGFRKVEIQKEGMQERRDTVKEGFRTGRIHDRRDT